MTRATVGRWVFDWYSAVDCMVISGNVTDAVHGTIDLARPIKLSSAKVPATSKVRAGAGPDRSPNSRAQGGPDVGVRSKNKSTPAMMHFRISPPGCR